MKDKLKLICCVAVAVLVLLCGISAFVFLSRSATLLSALPLPDETRPYALVEAKDGGYPTALSSLLTDGAYAQFRAGTARNCLLLLASEAEECALLVDQEPDESLEIYAALRFPKSDMKMLKKGELPDSWKIALQSPEIMAGPAKDTWMVRMAQVEQPLYYKVDGSRAVMAADDTTFKKLLSVLDGGEKDAGKFKWNDEKSWPGHIEICDGGLLFADKTKKADERDPLKLQAAWNKPQSRDETEVGEAKWSITGLDKIAGTLALSALTAKKWDTQNCLIPDPLLLSAGFNIPKLGGSPADWPFPLSSLGELGHKMDLSDGEIRDLLSGQTVFSLGGRNRILWFTLPGFMVELSGGRDKLEPLVSKFWQKLFPDSEVKPASGFEYGGSAQVPFSVVGAGRGDMALLGLISPESISEKNRLGKFLGNDEKAIGWVIADLPRIGAALSQMTKMNSFMQSESDEDLYNGPDTNDQPQPQPNAGEPFQPEGSVTPFDQGVSDAFGGVLKRLGKVLVVWEKPESGRINWYRTAAKEEPAAEEKK